MPQNMDKTRSVVTVDDERTSLPYSVFLAPGSYTINPDGSITINGGGGGSFTSLVLAGVLTPAQLADATVEDLNLGSLAAINVIEFTSAGNNAAIGGIIPTDVLPGQVFMLANVGGFDITLLDESGGSAPANTFGLNGDKLMPPNSAYMIYRPHTAALWLGVGA